ncbi:hypothetical protein FPV67DRAFT_1472413 [Lyophyllum atratum]|nr:hypothetical protein FPV67DRAFT_1472413 [Lyophyllum atratum]
MFETSPPPYTEAESTRRTQPPSQLPTPVTAPGRSGPAGEPMQYPQNHDRFGPTPLSPQLLTPYAYYDPWSPHSMTLADARARRRFIGAFLWGVAIWCIMGLLFGEEVVNHAKRRW